MLMVFRSDNSVQSRGFAATHSTGIIFIVFNIFKILFKKKLFIACGGLLKATSRVKHFYSHAKYGDFDYNNNAECDWTIEADSGRNVQLTFMAFDVRI